MGLCVRWGRVVCTVVTGLQSDGDIAESCVVPPGALRCASLTADTTFRGWPQWTSKVRLGHCQRDILAVVVFIYRGFGYFGNVQYRSGQRGLRFWCVPCFRCFVSDYCNFWDWVHPKLNYPDFLISCFLYLAPEMSQSLLAPYSRFWMSHENWLVKLILLPIETCFVPSDGRLSWWRMRMIFSSNSLNFSSSFL